MIKRKKQRTMNNLKTKGLSLLKYAKCNLTLFLKNS